MKPDDAPVTLFTNALIWQWDDDQASHGDAPTRREWDGRPIHGWMLVQETTVQGVGEGQVSIRDAVVKM